MCEGMENLLCYPDSERNLDFLIGCYTRNGIGNCCYPGIDFD